MSLNRYRLSAAAASYLAARAEYEQVRASDERLVTLVASGLPEHLWPLIGVNLEGQNDECSRTRKLVLESERGMLGAYAEYLLSSGRTSATTRAACARVQIEELALEVLSA